MDKQGVFDKLIESLVDLDRDGVKNFVKEALESGVPPMEVLNEGLTPGLRQLGELFNEGELFLPELLLAADISMEIMNDLSERFGVGDQIEKLGKCLIATVEGDVHDIGKSLVGMIMSANGYEVIDVGKDVPNERLIELVKEHKPDIVGLSSLLSTTMPAQKEFVEMAIEAGIRDSIKIMVGGAPVSREWAEKIGADGYAEDASSGVAEADRLLKSKK